MADYKDSFEAFSSSESEGGGDDREASESRKSRKSSRLQSTVGDDDGGDKQSASRSKSYTLSQDFMGSLADFGSEIYDAFDGNSALGQYSDVGSRNTSQPRSPRKEMIPPLPAPTTPSTKSAVATSSHARTSSTPSDDSRSHPTNSSAVHNSDESGSERGSSNPGNVTMEALENFVAFASAPPSAQGSEEEEEEERSGSSGTRSSRSSRRSEGTSHAQETSNGTDSRSNVSRPFGSTPSSRNESGTQDESSHSAEENESGSASESGSGERETTSRSGSDRASESNRTSSRSNHSSQHSSHKTKSGETESATKSTSRSHASSVVSRSTPFKSKSHLSIGNYILSEKETSSTDHGTRGESSSSSNHHRSESPVSPDNDKKKSEDIADKPPEEHDKGDSNADATRSREHVHETEKPVVQNKKSAKEEVRSAASSDFSTLSQHLHKAPEPQKQPIAAPAAKTQPPMQDQPSAVPSARTDPGKSTVSQNSKQEPTVSPTTAAAPFSTATAFTPPPPPPPKAAADISKGAALTSASPIADLSSTPFPTSSLQSTLSPATAASSGRAFPAPIGGSAVLPPPLPPPGAGLANAAQPASVGVSAKAQELQIASEAVERLIRAFATLRGHAPVESSSVPGENADRFRTSKAVSTMAEQRMHNVMGDPVMSHPVPLGRQYKKRMEEEKMRRANLKTAQSDHLIAVKANEELLEQTMLALVMEMLEKDDGKRNGKVSRSTGRARDRSASRKPAAEVVTTDDFMYGTLRSSDTASKSRRGHRVQMKAGDSNLQDGDSTTRRASKGCFERNAYADPFETFGTANGERVNDDFFDAIQSALRKYVLDHVTRGRESYSRDPFPLVGAPFARMVLLDLLAVCVEVTESCFVESPIGCTWPGLQVIVQYDGPSQFALFATNAIHCLPFEAVFGALKMPNQPSISDAGSGDGSRPKYRLEYWVTKDKMWVVIAALIQALRDEENNRSNPYNALTAQHEPSRAHPGIPTDELSSTVKSNHEIMMALQRKHRVDGHTEEVLPLMMRAPLFSLLDAARTARAMATMEEGAAPVAHNGRTDTGSHHTRNVTRGSEGNVVGNTFDLPSESLGKVAFALSKMSLSMVVDDSTSKLAKLVCAADYPSTAGDVTPQKLRGTIDTVVCDAIVELLGDEAIQQAVHRRALGKLRDRAVTLSKAAVLGPDANVDAAAKGRERNQRDLERMEQKVDHMIARIRDEMQTQKPDVGNL